MAPEAPLIPTCPQLILLLFQVFPFPPTKPCEIRLFPAPVIPPVKVGATDTPTPVSVSKVEAPAKAPTKYNIYYM